MLAEKRIFSKTNINEKQENNGTDNGIIKKSNKIQNKNSFIDNISVKEDYEEIAIIERVKKDRTLMNNMNIEELQSLNKIIKKRKSFLDKKLNHLKNEIAIKKMK